MSAYALSVCLHYLPVIVSKIHAKLSNTFTHLHKIALDSNVHQRPQLLDFWDMPIQVHTY